MSISHVSQLLTCTHLPTSWLVMISHVHAGVSARYYVSYTFNFSSLSSNIHVCASKRGIRSTGSTDKSSLTEQNPFCELELN